MTRRTAESRRIAIRRSPYFLPYPLASDEDARRFHHLDLETMSPAQRWAECERARSALAEVLSGDDPIIVYGSGLRLHASSWLSERVTRAKGAG